MNALSPLPIDARVSEIVAALARAKAVVLVAEPGAGKTTRVPRALLDAGFAERGEILVLEPRRLAARMAARRVAEELGEPVGERVGYQVRFDERASARTRIRFVTEGILTRRLSSDPELRGVSTVILDELHERHLHADVALALLTRLRKTKRPDLHVMAMSATLDAAPVARLLEAPVIEVEGRTFPVAIEHAERDDDRSLDVLVRGALRKLLQANLDGDVLVFLPGASEIRRARESCEPLAREAGVELHLLHGELSSDEQDRAVKPSSKRKVILATNVAETSITLPNIAAVIDSGLARVARHSPWSGLPALTVEKVSRASATQRAGRAGRTRAGVCIRLFTRLDHDARPAHAVPEILRADLAETLLSLAASQISALSIDWLDPPPLAAREAAEALLARLGACDGAGAITPLGRRMQALPLHPRLARLVLDAEARGAGDRGCLLAALAGEREIRVAARTRLHGGEAKLDEVGPSDLLARAEAFEAVESTGSLSPDRLRSHGLDVNAAIASSRAASEIARAIGRTRRGDKNPKPSPDSDEPLLIATLAAFPDRVAKRRSPRSHEVVFAGGGSARLTETSVVREAEWMVVVEAEERRGQGVIARMASAIAPEWLLDFHSDHLKESREVRFDAARERVVVVSALHYDGLLLDEKRSDGDAGDDVAKVLADAALARGPEAFADVAALDGFRARVAFVARLREGFPLLDDAAVRDALRSLCAGKTSFAELRHASLESALESRLAPSEKALLERWAPRRVTLPGGRQASVTYPLGEPAQAPFIASRLQDFFGMREGPKVGDGRVPLVLHLLAPNQRDVQVTSDLAGFWERHYPALRRQLMRRYPKHAWPDDPLHADPPKPRR